MGYKMENITLRIISQHDGKTYKPFTADLYVDSCRHPNRRYTVYTNNHAADYSFYEIITPEDDARVRYAKWNYIQGLIKLRNAEIDAYNNLVKYTQNKTLID
jgi:hypothetical protein